VIRDVLFTLVDDRIVHGVCGELGRKPTEDVECSAFEIVRLALIMVWVVFGAEFMTKADIFTYDRCTLASLSLAQLASGSALKMDLQQLLPRSRSRRTTRDFC